MIIVGGDLNLFLDSLTEVERGNPVLKEYSISNLIEKHNLCNIWKIRKTKGKSFTFCKK